MTRWKYRVYSFHDHRNLCDFVVPASARMFAPLPVVACTLDTKTAEPNTCEEQRSHRLHALECTMQVQTNGKPKPHLETTLISLT